MPREEELLGRDAESRQSEERIRAAGASAPHPHPEKSGHEHNEGQGQSGHLPSGKGPRAPSREWRSPPREGSRARGLRSPAGTASSLGAERRPGRENAQPRRGVQCLHSRWARAQAGRGPSTLRGSLACSGDGSNRGLGLRRNRARPRRRAACPSQDGGS